MSDFDRLVDQAKKMGWIAKENGVKITYPVTLTQSKKLLIEFANLAIQGVYLIKPRGYDYKTPLNKSVTYRNIYNLVFNQGLQSTCMSHAIAWMLQARGILMGYPNFSLSPLHFHYCSLKLGGDNGVNQFRAMQEIMQIGFPSYSGLVGNWRDSTFCLVYPSEKMIVPKANYIIKNSRDLKFELSMHGPVVANAYVDPVLFEKYDGGVYAEWGDSAASRSHAICVVGYDDNIEAWEVVNSAGLDWGFNGVGFIKYGHCGIAVDPDDPLICFDL
jgi:hypothetical protein